MDNRLTEFTSDEFGGQVRDLPFVQILNPSGSDKSGGFAISRDQLTLLADCYGVVDPQKLIEGWVEVGRHFTSGEVTFYTSKEVELTVISRTPLILLDRDTSEYIPYQKGVYYANTQRFTPLVKYIVGLWLQGEIYPVKFSGRKLSGQRFATFMKQGREHFEAALPASTSKRGTAFDALCKYSAKLELELVGGSAKSWIYATKLQPKQVVLDDNLFPPSSEMGAKLLGLYKEYEGFFDALLAKAKTESETEPNDPEFGSFPTEETTPPF